MSFDLFLDWGWDFCNELVLANSLVDGVLDKKLYWTVVAGLLTFIFLFCLEVWSWDDQSSGCASETSMCFPEAAAQLIQLTLTHHHIVMWPGCFLWGPGSRAIHQTLTVPGEQNPGPMIISVAVVPQFWNSCSISSCCQAGSNSEFHIWQFWGFCGSSRCPKLNCCAIMATLNAMAVILDPRRTLWTRWDGDSCMCKAATTVAAFSHARISISPWGLMEITKHAKQKDIFCFPCLGISISTWCVKEQSDCLKPKSYSSASGKRSVSKASRGDKWHWHLIFLLFAILLNWMRLWKALRCIWHWQTSNHRLRMMICFEGTLYNLGFEKLPYYIYIVGSLVETHAYNFNLGWKVQV